VLAKVTRDALMRRLAARFPEYSWADNAGYGTAQHRAILEKLGPTPLHRRSFRLGSEGDTGE
jgi:ribonuclease HII